MLVPGVQQSQSVLPTRWQFLSGSCGHSGEVVTHGEVVGFFMSDNEFTGLESSSR